MGGFQVDNEASMAHKQSRASVMSVQTNEPVGGQSEGSGARWNTRNGLKVLTFAVRMSYCSSDKGDSIIVIVANC